MLIKLYHLKIKFIVVMNRVRAISSDDIVQCKNRDRHLVDEKEPVFKIPIFLRSEDTSSTSNCRKFPMGTMPNSMENANETNDVYLLQVLFCGTAGWRQGTIRRFIPQPEFYNTTVTAFEIDKSARMIALLTVTVEMAQTSTSGVLRNRFVCSSFWNQTNDASARYSQLCRWVSHPMSWSATKSINGVISCRSFIVRAILSVRMSPVLVIALTLFVPAVFGVSSYGASKVYKELIDFKPTGYEIACESKTNTGNSATGWLNSLVFIAAAPSTLTFSHYSAFTTVTLVPMRIKRARR